jgi:hypothetical protein
MATDSKKGTSDHADTPPAAPTPSGPEPLWSAPVYFDRRKKRGKKKRRYTKGTKAFQRLNYGADRAAYRTANAFAKGLRTFARRSNRSGRRRKDGLVRDSLRNFSRGFAVGAREFGNAPSEIASRIGTRNVRRAFLALNSLNPFGR